MPFNKNESLVNDKGEKIKDIEKDWSVQYLRPEPHPEDLMMIMQRVAKGHSDLPADYKCKSKMIFLYQEFENGVVVDSSGEFGATGDWVRPIVENVKFHTDATAIVAKMISGDLTEEEIAETFGLEEIRKKMANYTANLGFGQEPFVVGEE